MTVLIILSCQSTPEISLSPDQSDKKERQVISPYPVPRDCITEANSYPIGKNKNRHNLFLDQVKDDNHIPACGIIKGDIFLARNIECNLSTKSNNTNIIADSILSPHSLSNIVKKKRRRGGG